MTARRPRFDVRAASGTIFLILAAALVANAAFAVLYVRPKTVLSGREK